MKRTICLLMALAMLASVLPGCGGKQEEAVQAAPKVENITETAAEEVTEAPTTEPALSAEEVLYASLPEKVRYAVDLGIVELGRAWMTWCVFAQERKLLKCFRMHAC